MESPSPLPVTMSRRGVVIAAASVGAAFLLKSRPESVQPRPLNGDRDFPDTSLVTAPEALYQTLVTDRTYVNLIDGSSLASYRSRHIPGAQPAWWQDSMELNSVFFSTLR